MRPRKLSLLLVMVRKRWAMLGRQAPEVMDTAGDSKLRTRSGRRPLRPKTSTTGLEATKARWTILVPKR
jgi:hypothetical protein